MNMIEVTSSQIRTMGHDEATETMRVEFHNGSSYLYSPVPAALFKEIVESESVGKAFNEKIKKKPDTYPYVKVG